MTFIFLVAFTLTSLCSSFLLPKFGHHSPSVSVSPPKFGLSSSHPRSFCLHAVDPNGLSFDPNQLDPVVVSGAFWSTIRTKIISSIIGNLIGGFVLAVGGGVVGAAIANFNGDKDKREISKTFSSIKSTITSKTEELKSNISTDTSVASPSHPSLLTFPSTTALLISITLDLLGDASYSLPFLGDASDIIFAPIAGIILYKLYGSNVITVLGIFEELLPGADFIPTGTIAWYFKYVVKEDNRIRRFFGFEEMDDTDVKSGKRDDNDDDVIDVDKQ